MQRLTAEKRRDGEPVRAQREPDPGERADRVVAAVNGVRVYSGDDGYRSRDHRFLGTVGFYDTLWLPVRAGRNEVTFAVSENFGGWVIGARLAADSATRRDGNPYLSWIEMYASAEYQGLCEDTIPYLEDLAGPNVSGERFAELAKTFDQATRLEIGFWDMGMSAASEN